jgi:hypothetical protein
VTAINPPASGSRPVGQLVTGAVSRLARSLTAVASKARASRVSITNSALQVGGLGCFDVGAFQVASPLGWVVTGLSAFTLAWLLQPPGGGA